jgi:exonuclease III
MKIHLLSYNVQGLNKDGKVCKMNQFFRGMTLQMDIVCIHEHKLHDLCVTIRPLEVIKSKF